MNTSAYSTTSHSSENRLVKVSRSELNRTLVSLAENNSRRRGATFLNASSDNPNWLLSYPRKAYFLLGQFAMEEADRQPAFDSDWGIVASPARDGIAEKFLMFLDRHFGEIGAKVLRHIYNHAVADLKADADALVYELVDGIIGDHYPAPPRILNYTGQLTGEYLRWAMGGGDDMTKYDLLATEGNVDAMCGIIRSLKANRLLDEGDLVALFNASGADCDGLKLDTVSVRAGSDGQYPREELDKLRDKRVKVVCLANPSVPQSVSLSDDSLAYLKEIVTTDNPELMIITDDVCGTFVKGFRSLMYVLPYNTLCLYSFSKYFGATGWRVSVMALRPDNAFDARLSALPADAKAAADKRYEALSMEPDKIRFIDRLAADSRLVSTPQQIQMTLFAAFACLHAGEIQPKVIEMLHSRLNTLWTSSGLTLQPDPYRAGYYSSIDLLALAKKLYGDGFVDYVVKNREPIDFVKRLAGEDSIVVLSGDGFDGPAWSVRVSLASLDDDAYRKIGEAIRRVLGEYYAEYEASTK